MKRTAAIELDEPFEFVCDVTKSWEDPATGERFIRGVASGVAEDRDGERVSARAIAKMAAQPTAGGQIKLTSSHQQDWATEIGDVVVLKHDADSDELIYEAKLPPAGEDPIADKAWFALTKQGKKLGASIGGKLRKAYFELIEAAKGPGGRPRQRKVLDDIFLRHICLTETPSYRGTFSEAVAKTFTGEPGDDAEWVDEDPTVEAADAAEILAKAAPPRDDDEDDAQQAPDQDAETDADAPAQPPAATGDTAEQESDAQAAAQLPEAKRHLACPNCGHEFAADLPSTDTGEDDTTSNDNDEDDAQARKSHTQETTMDRTDETLAKIRALADDEPEVAKTDEPAPEAEAAPEPAAEVAKTDAPEADDVLKLVAASHRHNESAIAELREQTASGFEAVVKAVNELADRVAKQPTGRRSVARVLPEPGEVEKTATESDDVDKQVDEAPDAFTALKALNAARGIR